MVVIGISCAALSLSYNDFACECCGVVDPSVKRMENGTFLCPDCVAAYADQLPEGSPESDNK